MTDPAEFWKPPSTIEICEAQYDLAKSILEFVVEVKDDCSVLEHLFFQVAQLLESVIVSAPSFRFEDSNAVYRVSRISEQHDRNEQHFVDVLINEQNSEEYIRKHHTLDHELLLRHSLTLLEDELYQSVECLFVRSRRYCRLPARPFDIMLSHPFGATFALTSVSVHFFPAKYVMCTWQREQAVASRASVAYVWIANVHIERPVNKPTHGHSRYSSLSSHNNNCGRSPRCCAMRVPTRPPSAFRCRSLQARFKSVRGGCTYHARVASDASSRLIDEYRCVVGSYEKHSSRIMPWRQKTSMPFNGLALREIKVGRVGLSRSVGATHSRVPCACTVYSSIADPTLDSKRPRIRSLFCDAERSTSHTANHGALRNSDHLAALLRTCRYSSIVSALIEAHVSFRSSPVLQMSCFNHRVTNYRNLTFTSLMLDDQALKLLGTHCSHLASLHLSAITSISDKVERSEECAEISIFDADDDSNEWLSPRR